VSGSARRGLAPTAPYNTDNAAHRPGHRRVSHTPRPAVPRALSRVHKKNHPARVPYAEITGSRDNRQGPTSPPGSSTPTPPPANRELLRVLACHGWASVPCHRLGAAGSTSHVPLTARSGTGRNARAGFATRQFFPRPPAPTATLLAVSPRSWTDVPTPSCLPAPSNRRRGAASHLTGAGARPGATPGDRAVTVWKIYATTRSWTGTSAP